MNNKTDCHPENSESGQQIAKLTAQARLLKRHHPDQYAKLAAKYENEEYCTTQTLFHIDTQHRKRFDLRPYNSEKTFLSNMSRRSIEKKLTPEGLVLWSISSYYDTFSQIYDRSSTRCRAASRRSVQASHMEATPAILRDSNYLPRARAAQICGVRASRISEWTSRMTILPFYDTSTNTLLYPCDKIRELAPWRPFRFLREHLGRNAAVNYVLTAKKKKIAIFGAHYQSLYYAPELAHL